MSLRIQREEAGFFIRTGAGHGWRREVAGQLA
jgi:hypothetical protein